MSKFNTPTKAKPAKKGLITSEATPSTRTFEGGAGYLRDAKSELFLLGVTNFVGESSFYESASARDARFESLVRKVVVSDPEWFANFVSWLRDGGNMRSASLVAAIEGARALIEAGVPGGRALVDSALQRPDEPGEALAYYVSKYGKPVPSAVKRGVSDAAIRLYSEYALGKYDTASKGFRFGDVIDFTHPKAKNSQQNDLFKYALDRRRDAKTDVPESLTTLNARATFLSASPGAIRARLEADPVSFAESLKSAGLTWEALSGAISGGMDAAAWEAVIPQMGYMALLRNLRNFEQAGVSNAVLDVVARTLSDPENVAKSRQLPMRFLSAYNATKGSLRFGYPLENALNASLANVPELSGRTLILVDRSGSMFGTTYGGSYSRNSDLDYADTAAVFGTALALRAQSADLVQFGSTSAAIKFKKFDSVLPTLSRFTDLGGTNTASAVRAHYSGHDRVVILTDEQAGYGYYSSDPTKEVPASVPVYTWNLAGYQAGHGASGPNRITFGGLTDQSFGLIPLIERGYAAKWPWED